MKKLAIMQPYLFPYIGYFQLLSYVDEFVIYDDVQFMKRSWINRNSIIINEEKHLFTISLAGASTTKLINEIKIKDDFIKFLKMLKMAYSKAPKFEEVFHLIEKICSYEDKNLARFIGNSLEEIKRYLNLDTALIYSSDIDKNNHLKGQDKVIDICKTLHADIYINSIGGQELYDKAVFNEYDIELKFLQPNLIEYRQFSNEFVPGLSIIDVMMFNSVKEIQDMLLKYELR